jgi:outer membrane receptor protein involved in Fe transport
MTRGHCFKWHALPVLAALPALALAQAAGDRPVQNLPLGHFVDVVSLEQLADLVVTDTKVAQAADTVTQKIIVLHSEDFEAQPDSARNIAELMRYTSGQFVNILSRNDANWGSYAGLGPKYNSYLLDGLPIDSFVDAMSLDPWAIERIEAHKGPASVLYSNYLSMDFAGNEAPLAGTTNLILRDRIEAPLTRLQLGIGSDQTHAGRVYRQGRSGDLSYFLGGSIERSDYSQYGAPDSWLQTVKPPEYEKSRIYGKLSYALGRPDHTLSLFLHQTRQDGDLGRPNRDFAHRYDTLNFTYNNQLAEDLHVQFKAGERKYDRDFGNDDFPASLALVNHSETRQTIRPVDLTASYRHAPNALLTVGIDGQQVHYQTANRGNVGLTGPENDIKARSSGLFVQEKIQWQDWIFRAGARHNSIRHDYALLGGKPPAADGTSWSKTLWSLGARYNIDAGLALYANAGSSFMVPAAKQIGGTITVPTESGQLANPSLKPESGIGRDLGIDWRLAASLSLGLRVFLNTIDDAIVDNVVSATPSQTRSANAGRASARGIELDVRHSVSAALSWFANLTQTRTRVQDPGNPDQDGTAIPFTPDRVANLGLTARLPGQITLSPYYHRVGRYWDSTSQGSRLSFGHYGVLSLRLLKQLPDMAGASASLVVDLNNLTDRRYDMPWGFRDPGFNAFAGLRLTF